MQKPESDREKEIMREIVSGEGSKDKNSPFKEFRRKIGKQVFAKRKGEKFEKSKEE